MVVKCPPISTGAVVWDHELVWPLFAARFVETVPLSATLSKTQLFLVGVPESESVIVVWAFLVPDPVVPPVTPTAP